MQSLTVVSESGFYDVVVRSSKPQGKELRGLVTREILPALRKTGSYQVRLPRQYLLLLPMQTLLTGGSQQGVVEAVGGE